MILIGVGTVGKTSLTSRFVNDDFRKSYKQTIGLDFFMKQVDLPGQVQVALQVWDIGGQTLGGKMIGNYIYGAQAVLLVYDITNLQSFQDLEDWLDVVKKTFQGEEMPYLGLIGNKSDLAHIRAIKSDAHNKFADENCMYSYFVSAKSGDNVNSCFFRIAGDLAGVVLNKSEIELSSKVIAAEIVKHPAALPPPPAGRKGGKKGGAAPEGQKGAAASGGGQRGCAIM